jgi:hypothetical protein
VTRRRRRRRRRKLLDDLKERRGYSHLKEEAVDLSMWRAGFGRGFGPVVRQTAKLLNTVNNVQCVHTSCGLCYFLGGSVQSMFGESIDNTKLI